MLKDQSFVGLIPITDIERAKAFYCDVLGLPVTHEDPISVTLDAGGTALRLAVVEHVPEPVATNAGWNVADVPATVRALTDSGVVFERFPGMDQDEHGIWTPPGASSGVAWFRDPDGNRLSISQSS